MMRTCIFIPPLKKATGGTAVLLQLARHLHQGGYGVCLVPREDTMPAGDDHADIPVVRWDSLRLTPQDIWLVPEGWVNALTPGLQAGARSVVYVQNWAYLLSALPQGVHWNRLPVSFLNVSQPVAWFTREATGRQGPVLRPGIDTALFHASAARPDGPVRIAWMPRKNKALAVRIREFFEARRAQHGGAQVEWRELHGLTHRQVAEELRQADIFLATGFPEGCPLPPLEAMACGCVVTGFSGMGGWDYMRQAMPQGYTPWWPMRPPHETPWDGNGFFAADADVPAAALALEHAVSLVETSRTEPCAPLDSVRKNAQVTVSHYSLEKQREAVLDLWSQAALGNIFS
jgi:hypothetical protein